MSSRSSPLSLRRSDARLSRPVQTGRCARPALRSHSPPSQPSPPASPPAMGPLPPAPCRHRPRRPPLRPACAHLLHLLHARGGLRACCVRCHQRPHLPAGWCTCRARCRPGWASDFAQRRVRSVAESRSPRPDGARRVRASLPSPGSPRRERSRAAWAAQAAHPCSLLSLDNCLLQATMGACPRYPTRPVPIPPYARAKHAAPPRPRPPARMPDMGRRRR